MAGGFSPPPLGVAAGCSVLDMHLTRRETVLDYWQHALATLERAGVAGERLCLCGGSTPLPRSTLGVLRTIVDQSDYRGPAGALRDACERLGAETTIIAAEAARCCTADLGQMLAFHYRSGADVTVARNGDESPAGIYVFARALLGGVPHAGFMDLKEQWLTKLVAEGRAVMVHDLAASGAIPLRSRQEFLRAVRACSGVESDEAGSLEPRVLADRRCAGSVICDGAVVAPDAIIVDSVVLGGARVGNGALVARSIVGPGSVVHDGEQVIDAVVGPAGVTSEQGLAREDRR
jgi:mannose-1-phosphate guanylyltransferase